MKKDIEKIKVWEECKYLKLIEKFPARTRGILTVPELKSLEEIDTPHYLYGMARTGKSITAAQMALEWSLTKFVHNMQYEFVYTNVPELLMELRRTYKNEGVDEIDVINKYKNARLLILDDVGVMKSTEWAYQTLYTIIAHRYDEMKTTFYTSNYSLNELAAKLQDDRIVSRIAHECKDNIIQFVNTPYL